jgi:hypothetical protein
MRAAAAKPSQNSANTMSVCGSNASGCACWNSFSAATRGNLRPHATQLIPSAQPLRRMLSQVHPYRGENIRSSVSAWIHPVILIVQLTPSSSVRIPSPSSVVSAPLSGNNPETMLCLLALGIRLVAPLKKTVEGAAQSVLGTQHRQSTHVKSTARDGRESKCVLDRRRGVTALSSPDDVRTCGCCDVRRDVESVCFRNRVLNQCLWRRITSCQSPRQQPWNHTALRDHCTPKAHQDFTFPEHVMARFLLIH